MKEKTIFSREENTEALFNKILSDPWACEKLQETFLNYSSSSDELKDPLSSKDFTEILLNSYHNRDLSAFLMGICQNTVFDLLRNSGLIPYRFNADGKHDPIIMTDDKGELLPEYVTKASNKKYRHFKEVYNEMKLKGVSDGIYFASAYRYRHSYGEEDLNVKQNVVERALGTLITRTFADTLSMNKKEAEVYADIWDIMSMIEKNIPDAFVFYGQGLKAKNSDSYDEIGVFIPDHILSVNLKRNVMKARSILYAE